MDKSKALALLERLRGHQLGGWEIIDFIDNGKSGAVYRAIRESQFAAVKIYDDELITRFGDKALLERMQRERCLIGHDHPNIVKMYDWGRDDGLGHHYLVMELVEGQSLANLIPDFPVAAVPELMEQLASAAEFLESKGLAHRDIKPANIVVSPDYSRLVLLDLGVLRPVGQAGLTDYGGKSLFVGTNQYASPEFAMRREEDSITGWRAVTFYQIGAVLHDMLMQTPLFEEYTGVEAQLAEAVQTEVPQIRSATAPPYLVAVAQNCLVKSPEARLRLVSWENFRTPKERANPTLQLQERIRQRAAASQTLQRELKQYEGKVRSVDLQIIFVVAEIVHTAFREMGRDDPPLPRRIVYYQTKDRGELRCDFEPAASLSLPLGLTIYVSIHVVDLASKIIEIKGAASTVREGAAWKPEQLNSIYFGQLDEKSINEALLLFVLTQVDLAQQKSDISIC